MFTWERLGKIFDPQTQSPNPWMREFAQCPTPFVLDEETIRVIVSTRPPRDAQGGYVSRPGYVDLSRRDLRQIVAISPQALLPLGLSGSFDEFGIMPSSLVRTENVSYLYYTGWTRMASVPYTTAIGVAISHDQGRSFTKLGPGPLLGLSLDDPYLVSSPIVRIVGETWHMWYVTGRYWLESENGPEIVFQLAHAISTDGLEWNRSDRSIIPTVLADECQDQFCPIQIEGRWHAFFAYRNATDFRASRERGYRLGYATSLDLRTWERDDSKAGIALADSGWDSQMMCSTQFIELDGQQLMFYCGNDFGREGFGIAALRPI